MIAGAVFCFRGYLAMRTAIGIWGSFVGFGIGAGLVAQQTQQPLLGGPLGWAGAVVGALLFGALAYTVYAVAVVLTMGSVGYALGGGIAGLLDLPPLGIAVVGLIMAALLIVVALMTDLPRALLMITAALGGAAAIVFGLALVTGLLAPSPLEPDLVAEALGERPWLDVVYVVLVIAGLTTQLRRRSTANLRAAYR